MQTNARKVVGLSSRLTQELEAFEPQSVYDAAMAMRYTKTGVTDTSKIEMIFGLEVYYTLLKHSYHIAMGVEGQDICIFCRRKEDGHPTRQLYIFPLAENGECENLMARSSV